MLDGPALVGRGDAIYSLLVASDYICRFRDGKRSSRDKAAITSARLGPLVRKVGTRHGDQAESQKSALSWEGAARMQGAGQKAL
jgi:hypothetical protein